MSKIKALIATLVLGSSSVAMADSGLSFNASTEARWSFGTRPVVPAVQPAPTASIIRDHRTNESFVPSRYRAPWIALSEPMTVHPGRNTIRLASPARYSQLRVQSTAGASYIGSVMVQYTDGTRQVLEVNKWLDTRAPTVSLAISDRASIDRIIVRGPTSTRGSTSMRGTFQLFGSAMYKRPAEPQPYPQPQPLPPVYQPADIVLAHDLNFANTDGRRFITVGADKGRLGTLRISGIDGATYVQMVEVAFTDGSTQLMGMVNTNLARGQSVDLQLDGRGSKTVDRVVIWTSDKGQRIATATGQFSVSAF